MRPHALSRFSAAAVCVLALTSSHAQKATPEKDAVVTDASASKISVQANLVVVPAVVFDKKGLVTTLKQGDFAISVDGKPQTVRYFDLDTDVPLTVGLLVDVSRSQTSVLEAEQKASQTFLDSFLKPAAPNRPADKAFILQFAHTAELLQDVTDSRPLLAAGLKEIGTQAPNAPDEDASTQSPDPGTNPSAGGNNNPGNSGGNGGYGRRGGSPNGGNTGGTHGSQARGGTVLYDSLYLAAGDVLKRQKGRRALIVLTDGVDRHSKESLLESIEAAQRADTVVYAVYYKGREDRGFNDRDGYGGPGYGNPGGYGRPGYGRPSYPGSGGTPGSDGTYADPDGKKILGRICTETGGRMYEVKGKGSVDEIYKQIGDELRAQYRLGFTPSYEAAGKGYHPIQLTLTNPESKKLEIQTRNGYYTGVPNPD